jgi:hypothetical protein
MLFQKDQNTESKITSGTMNPERQALLEGRPPSGRRESPRDITSPRRDPNTRITKPSRANPSLGGNARPTRPTGGNPSGSYQTQDDLSRQFVADEDKFVLKQSKKKADIRVREGRAKPIDYLAFNLRVVDSDRDPFDDDEKDFTIKVPAPEDLLQHLNEGELKELDEGIKSYLALERNATNKEYWSCLQTLCTDRGQKLNPRGPEGRAVNSVASDIDKILSPKTYEQLEALEKQIRAKLRSNEPIDTDYWEELLKSLLVWKAKARLKKINEGIRETRLELLKKANPELAEAMENASDAAGALPVQSGQSQAVAHLPAAQRAPVPATAGSSGGTAPVNTRFAEAVNEDFSQTTKALYEREVARGIGENEEIFTAEEVDPTGAKPKWADKYRPRKPRYFNRVQMGYEWNKYNQTHYDHDNPPPKVVQGYKFNIFYPDLIDKTKAPTYKIIREHGRRRGETFAPAGEEDTCLIRFIAGPPYEDIAFRIVDREWDYSAKKDRGFKSSFDKVCPSSTFSSRSPRIPFIPPMSVGLLDVSKHQANCKAGHSRTRLGMASVQSQTSFPHYISFPCLAPILELYDPNVNTNRVSSNCISSLRRYVKTSIPAQGVLRLRFHGMLTNEWRCRFITESSPPFILQFWTGERHARELWLGRSRTMGFSHTHVLTAGLMARFTRSSLRMPVP